MSNHTKPNNVTTPLTVAPGDPHWSEPEHDQRSMEQLYDYHDPVSLQQGGYTTGGALTMFGKVGFEPGQAVMNVDHGTIYDMILTRRYGTQGTYDFVVSQDMKNSNGVLGEFRTDVEHGFDICKVDLDMTTLNDEVTAMSNNRFRVRMKDGEARKVLKVIVPYRTAVRTFDAVELEKEFTYWVKEKSYSFAGYNEWEHYKQIQPLHYEIMTDFSAAEARFTSKDSEIQYMFRDEFKWEGVEQREYAQNDHPFMEQLQSSAPLFNKWNGLDKYRTSENLPLRLDFTDEMIFQSNVLKDKAMPSLAYPNTSILNHAIGPVKFVDSKSGEEHMAPDPTVKVSQSQFSGCAPEEYRFGRGFSDDKSLVREPKKYTQSHLEKARDILTAAKAFQPRVSQHRTRYRVKTLPTPTSFVSPEVGLPGSDEWVDQYPVYDHDTLMYTVGNSYDTAIFSRVYADVNPMFIHKETPGLNWYDRANPRAAEEPACSSNGYFGPTPNKALYYAGRSWMFKWTSTGPGGGPLTDSSENHYLTWFNSSTGPGFYGSESHYGYYQTPQFFHPDFAAKVSNESASERARIGDEIRSLVGEVSGYEGGTGRRELHYEANFYIAGRTPASTLYDYVVGNTDATSFRSKKLDLHTASETQIWDSDYTSYDQPTQGEVVFTTSKPDHIVLNDDSRSAIFNWKGVVNDASIQDGVITRYVIGPAEPIYAQQAITYNVYHEIEQTISNARPGWAPTLDQHITNVLSGNVNAGIYFGQRGPADDNLHDRTFRPQGPAIIPIIRGDGKTQYEPLAPGTYDQIQNNVYGPNGPRGAYNLTPVDTWYKKVLQGEPALGTWTQNDISLSGVQGPGEDNTSHVLYDLSNLVHEADTYKKNADLKGYYKSCVNHVNREIRLEISKFDENDPVEMDLTTRSELFINKSPIYEVLAHAQYDDTVREEYRMSPAPTMKNLVTWHDAPTEPSVVDQIFVPDGALNASDVLFLSLEAGSLSGGSIPTSKQVIAAPVKSGTLQIVSSNNPTNAQISKFITPIIKVARGNTYTLDTFVFKNTGGKPITIHMPLNPGDPLAVGETAYVESLDATTGAVTNATGDKTDDWTVTINNTGNLSQAQVNGLSLNNTYIMEPDDTLEIIVELNVTSHASTYDISIPVEIDNAGLLTSGGIVFPTISIT